jgi:hypothetical protein
MDAVPCTQRAREEGEKEADPTFHHLLMMYHVYLPKPAATSLSLHLRSTARVPPAVYEARSLPFLQLLTHEDRTLASLLEKNDDGVSRSHRAGK